MAGHGNHQPGELGRLACANRADTMLDDHEARLDLLEPSVASRQLVSQKNQPNGYAGLGSDGKLLPALLPTVEPTGNSWEADDEAGMLALSSAIAGDIAWREDTSTFWQLKANPYSTLANWKERVDNTPGVTAINNTLTGNVTGVELQANKGAANGYASLDVDGKIPASQMRADSALITHINEYHKWDLRRFGAVMNTDITGAIIAALLEGQAMSTPGQYGQNGTTGAYQGGSVLNGGCDLYLPVGTWFCGNIQLSHRAGIHGDGAGSILKRLPGTTGNWITNRRDGSVHAKYGRIHDLHLHGNWNASSGAPSGTAVRFLGETGYTDAAYKNPLDEDYDEQHTMWNVMMTEINGDALRVEGSGEFRGHNINIRTVAGLGVYFWQDNWLSHSSISHTGKMGVFAEGDDNRFNGVKCWYNGELVSTDGQGFKLSGDSGVLAGCSTQDTWAQGVLFDGAHGWAVAGLMVDSASKVSKSAYAAIDIWNSKYLCFGGVVARNRYRPASPLKTGFPDGLTGATEAVNIGGGSRNLYGDIAATIDPEWGLATALRGSSKAGANSRLFINDNQVANA